MFNLKYKNKKMILWLEKNPKISWAITIIIGIIIFYISSLSNIPGPAITGPNLNASLYHISAFFFFSFFLHVSLIKGKHRSLSLIAITTSILYSITDEIHQYFVPGRFLSLNDIFLNTIGISFAFLIYFISLEIKTKHL